MQLHIISRGIKDAWHCARHLFGVRDRGVVGVGVGGGGGGGRGGSKRLQKAQIACIAHISPAYQCAASNKPGTQHAIRQRRILSQIPQPPSVKKNIFVSWGTR